VRAGGECGPGQRRDAVLPSEQPRGTEGARIAGRRIEPRPSAPRPLNEAALRGSGRALPGPEQLGCSGGAALSPETAGVAGRDRRQDRPANNCLSEMGHMPPPGHAGRGRCPSVNRVPYRIDQALGTSGTVSNRIVLGGARAAAGSVSLSLPDEARHP